MKAIARAMGLLLFALIGLTACQQSENGQIKAVIERLDHEQEDAFSAHDPKLMEDDSTAQNLTSVIQSNDDMASAGAVGIRLSKLEWGDIRVTSSSTATATTWETWDTTFADGQTFSDRQRNEYRLLKIGGSWKVDADDHPMTTRIPQRRHHRQHPRRREPLPMR